MTIPNINDIDPNKFPPGEIPGGPVDAMTPRDIFAAHALIGVVVWEALMNLTNHHEIKPNIENKAKSAFLLADAMMKERGR